MRTFPLIVLILASVSTVEIVKAQQEEPRQIGGWGSFIDPAGDCRIENKGDQVTIIVPGTHHNLNPLPEFDNTLAPRVLQKVSGDFDAQVKVRKYPEPKPDTSNNSVGHSYVAAGLLLWQDDTNFMRWFRAANGERGDVFVHVEGYQDGTLCQFPYAPEVRNKDHRITNKDTYLRLVRKGDHLTFYRSFDGNDWEPFAVFRELELDIELRVGVAAVNSTTTTFAPQFEGFELEAQP